MVLDGTGQPVDIGRVSRVVPRHLRRAVAARDRGCAFPGCAHPPSWCDAHHVIEWQHGGPTAIDNLVMLCRFHHRLIHGSEWQMQMARGAPEFIPPKWVDPAKPHDENRHHNPAFDRTARMLVSRSEVRM